MMSSIHNMIFLAEFTKIYDSTDWYNCEYCLRCNICVMVN